MHRCFCGNLATSDNEERYKACVAFSGQPCDACQNIVSLNLQISEARAALERLLYQRQQLKTKVNENHSLVFRFEILPLEITTYIFELYVLDTYHDNLSASVAVTFKIPSPLILAAVCQSWRQIVLSTPCLWTQITVQLDEGRAAGQFQHVDTFLKRSGSLPVCIELSDDPDEEGRDDLEISLFMDMINVVNEYSHRWKSLALVNLPPFFYHLFSGNPQGAPLLEVLTIQPAFVDHEAGFSLDGGKPSPKTLKISDIYLSEVDVDFRNVTKVTAERVTISEILDIIRSSPSLTNCSWIDGLSIIDISSIHLTVRSMLQSLTIKCADSEGDCLELLNRLTLPALQHFSCDFNEEFPDHGGVLKSFFERSQCRLLDLSLYDAPYDKAGLVEVLNLLPSVKNASITPSDDFLFSEADAIHHALAHDSDGLLLPNLSSLKITVDSAFCWEQLPKFVFYDLDTLSRKRPLTYLKVAYRFTEHDFPDFIRRRDVELIRRMRAQGVDVIIENAGPGCSLDLDTDFLALSIKVLEGVD